MVTGDGGKMKQDDISKARKLAIPPEHYADLSKKDLYMLDQKFPEPIAQYWELKDFIIYLIGEYNLTRDTFRSFIFNNDGATQKDRELLVAWFFAKYISGLDKTGHYALALPKEDRGIDCYIRILNFKSQDKYCLPIQVSDIKLDSNTIDESNAEEVISVAAAKAKSKPMDCTETLLLLHILGQGDVEKLISLDPIKLRELFGNHEWVYRKIIIQQDSEENAEFCTVYSDGDEEHFRGTRKNGKSTIMPGNTIEDIRENKAKSNEKGQLSFIL